MNDLMHSFLFISFIPFFFIWFFFLLFFYFVMQSFLRGPTKRVLSGIHDRAFLRRPFILIEKVVFGTDIVKIGGEGSV